MIKSKKEFKVGKLVLAFAKKCQESIRWQGDGWGICWLDKQGNWQIFKSLLPIWKDVTKFAKLANTRMFLIHARSSSFKKDKNRLECVQPFFDEKIAFVFNGYIKGMKVGVKIPGKIGSQKIFNLLKKRAKMGGIEKGIQEIKKMIESNSQKIEALNIGVSDKKSFYVLCRHSGKNNYYGIRYFKEKRTIISSEKLPGFRFQTMKNGQFLIL